jgi:hypothetical protein
MILTTRYHYDRTIDKCVPFQYHGCGGNWNNFYTDTKCNARCRKNNFIFLIRNTFFFSSSLLVPYRETNHNYLDTLLTMRLGLGYITGVIVFILGAIFYIMCLPFVRKSGYFQVRIFLIFQKKERIFFFLKIVILLVSYVNTTMVNYNAFSWTNILEMVSLTR